MATNLDSFEILLNRQNGMYYSGEQIIGKVVYKVNQRFKINEVRLIAFGNSYCEWTETNSKSKDSSSETYSGLEEHYKNEVIFLTKIDDKTDLYLEEGQYSHLFQTSLLSNLPSSFHSENARIRYGFVATIQVNE